MLKIQIIIGSTRQQRFSEKPANWVYQLLRNHAEIDPELLDLRDYPLPFYNEPLSPTRLEGKYTDPQIQKWVNKIDEADGYIIVSPEYNHGYPAVLKNAIDYPYYEWNKKPISFVSYGSVGGARAIEQLRQVAIELHMAPIRNTIHIPSDVYIAANEKTTTNSSPVFAPLKEKAEMFIDELIWWGKALKSARQKS